MSTKPLFLQRKHTTPLDSPKDSVAVLLKVFRRVERKGGRFSVNGEESPAEATEARRKAQSNGIYIALQVLCIYYHSKVWGLKNFFYVVERSL